MLLSTLAPPEPGQSAAVTATGAPPVGQASDADDERLRSGVRTAPHTDDPERVARIHLDAGDHRRALSIVARSYGPSLARLCFAMLGRKDEADEAAQESLLALYDALPQFRSEGTLRAFLFGIARRTCAHRLEVRTRQARRGLLLRSDDDIEPVDPSRVVDRRKVREAIEALRPTEREALLLRYEADLPFREVALACGIDEAAARQRVSRALATLRVRLSDLP